MTHSIPLKTFSFSELNSFSSYAEKLHYLLALEKHLNQAFIFQENNGLTSITNLSSYKNEMKKLITQYQSVVLKSKDKFLNFDDLVYFCSSDSSLHTGAVNFILLKDSLNQLVPKLTVSQLEQLIKVTKESLIFTFIDLDQVIDIEDLKPYEFCQALCCSIFNSPLSLDLPSKLFEKEINFGMWCFYANLRTKNNLTLQQFKKMVDFVLIEYEKNKHNPIFGSFLFSLFKKLTFDDFSLLKELKFLKDTKDLKNSENFENLKNSFKTIQRLCFEIFHLFNHKKCLFDDEVNVFVDIHKAASLLLEINNYHEKVIDLDTMFFKYFFEKEEFSNLSISNRVLTSYLKHKGLSFLFNKNDIFIIKFQALLLQKMINHNVGHNDTQEKMISLFFNNFKTFIENIDFNQPNFWQDLKDCTSIFYILTNHAYSLKTYKVRPCIEEFVNTILLKSTILKGEMLQNSSVKKSFNSHVRNAFIALLKTFVQNHKAVLDKNNEEKIAFIVDKLTLNLNGVKQHDESFVYYFSFIDALKENAKILSIDFKDDVLSLLNQSLLKDLKNSYDIKITKVSTMLKKQLSDYKKDLLASVEKL